MNTIPIRDEWASRFGRRDPKILCVGLNYRSHADESQFNLPAAPLLFGKFANTLCAHDEPVLLPTGIGHVDAEAELAAVIGTSARGLTRENALDAVGGWTCANDVSAREAQFADGQWFRGKNYDTFCPIGPTIVGRDELDPSNVTIVQRLNGTVMQESHTSKLIFGVADLVAYASNVVTLEPGDLILTGTPDGVGYFRQPPVALTPGDVMEVEITGIGVLRNPVEST